MSPGRITGALVRRLTPAGISMTSPTTPFDHHGTASDASLFSAWRASADEGARDELIERYLPLARKLATRYARSGEPFDDLAQVASVGLIKAVERFDPSHGTAFTSYAVPTILGELKRHFRDTTWTLQVDRRSQERARAVRIAQGVLSAAGRSPTVEDIACFLGCDGEEVLEGLQASHAYSAVSLDAPSGSADDGGPTTSLAETVGGADEQLARVDQRATLDTAFQHLPKLERRIVQMRFAEDLSQREIADRVGISQMHVSRLLRRALAQLKEQLGDRPAAA